MRRLVLPLFAIALVLSIALNLWVDDLRSQARTSPDRGENTPAFLTPVQCSLGKDCFVMLYTDRDPGPGEVDFGCGRMTYNGHTGTDFAIPDLAAMARGVPVVAAADGKVLRTRDGVEDRKVSSLQDPQVRGRECGNGMVIDHGNGWETQYCHLRQNSLQVKPNQTVSAGSVLGYVGESGAASFPHVHFEVRHQRRVVDPFLGPNAPTGCNVPARPLWRDRLSYVPTGMMSAGLSGREPSAAEGEKGTMTETQIPDRSPGLFFWARPYGVLAGDLEQMRLTSPDGQEVSRTSQTLDRPTRQRFIYIGKRAEPGRPFMQGTWRGEYRLRRNGKEIVNIRREATITTGVGNPGGWQFPK